MTTKLIGIKEFRQNMTKLYKRSQKENIRFIVMNHSVPVMEVHPIMDTDLVDRLFIEKYKNEIEESLQQARKGQTFSAEDVRKMLDQ